MNLLLDTHAVIWFITEDEQLSYSLKAAVNNPDNTCFVSIASHWEISIKHSLGKLELKTSLAKIFQLIDQSGITLLPITPTHVLASSTLSFFHRDPFDRLIIAQAMSEGFTLMSKDQVFKEYPINLIWNDSVN